MMNFARARNLGYRTEADFADYVNDDLNPFKILADRDDCCRLNALVDQLDSREKELILERFYTDNPKTIEELAGIYGRTKKRIYSLIKNAIVKIGMVFTEDSKQTSGYVKKIYVGNVCRQKRCNRLRRRNFKE
jgi:DNA-directed RNA polymerase sigma subunit (sigma70/sigma32)